uniref:Uncharacterized protein n=1 Tax=Anguilla anguilla TaxID=7936 RepID=A0A0E9W794_ANGAN
MMCVPRVIVSFFPPSVIFIQ